MMLEADFCSSRAPSHMLPLTIAPNAERRRMRFHSHRGDRFRTETIARCRLQSSEAERHEEGENLISKKMQGNGFNDAQGVPSA
ncbi:hypothetical protein GJ744_002674 [Endocarpon pusillum]|uniref:Uncharacterized protein n=1 Tax=Endocarpon pusillum TaxID=364733 RepID=A0A8H7A7J8_9EURO|nr:hypothetical protein GJ744_002674 [Endocarpon pusillum]